MTECKSCDLGEYEDLLYCEGCGTCQDCCNCTLTDCDCDTCIDRRQIPVSYDQCLRIIGSKIKRNLYNKIINNCIEDDNGCWVWRGSTSGPQNGCRGTRGGGYGRISFGGATMAVHRLMYTLIDGPIPHKKQIDHTCKNRLCCNPQHLECVTHKQNQKRRDKK